MSLTNKIILLLLIAVVALTVLISATTLKWKPLMFDNPGTKRLLKSSTGNYYFYRSLPEKSMTINVKDLSAIEIRAMSKAEVSNPQFIIKYENKRTSYNLTLLAVSEQYRIYQPMKITLPPGLTKLELICYDRDTYFRVFMPVQVQSKKAKVPALKITSLLGEIEVSGPLDKKKYYSFDPSKALTYQVRQNLPYTLYIRAELTKKEKPIFGLYEDGKLIHKYELSLKRTNTYKAEGITHLTIGRKLDYPAQDKTKQYELRALTNHRFIARPVIRKVQ